MNKAINKIVDLPKLVKTTWIILWITLLMFLGLKLCFNIWYPIVVRSQTFIYVCDFIDNNLWLQFIIGLISYLFNINIWFLTVIKSKKYDNLKNFIILNILILIVYTTKFFNNTLGGLLEFIYLLIIPTIINIKKNNFKNKYINLFFAIFIYVIITIWQANILFVRGLENVITTYSSVIYYVLQIDFYIFTIILWIGVSFMGFMGGGFLWGKSETELLEIKEKELKKEFPNKSLIEKIDKRLAKIKK